MSKFAPIDLCKKLVELGCRSDSGFVYPPGRDKPTDDDKWWSWDSNYPNTTAFYQNDFTGCHEQARENAKLVWPGSRDNPDYGEYYENHDQQRHEMIDSDDWVKFLENTLQTKALDELTKMAHEDGLYD